MLLDGPLRGKRRGPAIPAAEPCLACGAASVRGFCSACFRDLPWNDHACRLCAAPLPLLPTAACGPCRRRPPPFDAAYAAFRYAWPADRLLQGFKFSARLASGRVLALALAEYLALREAPRPDLLVPVPLHRRRLARRGFNQAAELSRALGPALGVAVRRTALRRTRATPPQLGQRWHGRRTNLRGAFTCSVPVSGLHVAVVDDVVTTGSTAAEVARTLRAAGAARISIYAVARA